MKTNLLLKKFLVTIIFFITNVWISNSATLYWTNYSGDNLWSTPGDGACGGNWDDGTCTFVGVPVAGDIVIFDAASNTPCTIDVSTPALAGFQINAGYTSTITQGGGFTLNVSSGTANFNISSAATFTGSAANITISGTYTQTAGTFTSTSGILSIAGNFTQSAGTFNANSGTVSFNSNSLTIFNTPTFYNFRVVNIAGSAALTITIDQSITISNNLSFLSGGANSVRPIVFNKGAGSGLINLKGAITSLGSYTGTTNGGTATLIFNGTGAQNIAGSSTNGAVPLCNLEFNSTTARTISVTAGTFATTSGNLTISGAGGDITINTGTLNVNGNITVTNTGTAGGGSTNLTINGTGSQNLTGNGTAGQGKLPNVVFSKSSGTVTLASVISANGNWTNNNSGTGAIAGGSSTVVFCSGATQAINGSATSHNFNHLTVDKSANTLSIGGSVSTLNIGGDVTLSNGTFDAGSATLNLTAASSTWSQSSGFTFTNGTSTVDFQGATSNTFAGTATTLNFYNLTFAGALTAPSNTLKIRNNFTNNGTFTHNSGVVEFDGSGTQTVGGTANPTVFYDMKVSTNAHTVNMANNANLVNKIDVTDGGTFDADGTGNDKVFTLLSTGTHNGYAFNGGGTAQVGDLSAGTFNGNVVYQRYVDGFTQWRTIGCPISGSKTIADWDATIYTSGFTGADSDPDAFTSIYTYDATGQAYAPVGNETDIISADDGTLDGKGFLAYIGNTAPGTVMSPGITLTNTGAIISGTKTPAVKTGYNLLANPYPAPINFSNFETTNTAVLSAKQYSVFDYYTGGFDVWDKSLGWSTNGRQNGVIANGAAFFIKAGSNTTVTFNESHKDASPDGNFLKLAQNPFKKMRLTISSTTATPYTNSMLLAFSPISSDNYNNEDAKPMSQLAANSPTISSYSADGQKLVINKMGDLTKPYDILVRATVGVTGTYTIKADSLINEITGCVVLEDKLTGTQTDLKAGNSYTFSISDTTNAPRFVLHINGVANAAFIASNTTVPTGGSVNFTNTSTGGTTYSWNFGDSNTSTVQNPSHVYTTTGTYTVTLTVTNGSCGSASTTQVITVESPLSISNSSSHNTMNVYNNGGNIVLNLNYDHVVKGTIEVFDVLGKNIHSQQFNGDRKQEIINLPNTVGTGIYLIRINSPDKTFTTRMFLSN